MKTFWAVFFAILAAAAVLFLVQSNRDRQRVIDEKRISLANSEIDLAARAVKVSMRDTTEGDIQLVKDVVASLRSMAKDPKMPAEKKKELENCADDTLSFLRANLGKYWVAKLDEPAEPTAKK